jgi:hypothetical protein
MGETGATVSRASGRGQESGDIRHNLRCISLPRRAAGPERRSVCWSSAGGCLRTTAPSTEQVPGLVHSLRWAVRSRTWRHDLAVLKPITRRLHLGVRGPARQPGCQATHLGRSSRPRMRSEIAPTRLNGASRPRKGIPSSTEKPRPLPHALRGGFADADLRRPLRVPQPGASPIPTSGGALRPAKEHLSPIRLVTLHVDPPQRGTLRCAQALGALQGGRPVPRYESRKRQRDLGARLEMCRPRLVERPVRRRRSHRAR